MNENDRKLLERLITGIHLCGERDCDTSDFLIWLACEGNDIIGAIRAAMEGATESQGPRGQSVSLEWQVRQMKDQLDATTELARKVRAVWALWLTDARKGAINPGTFDAMGAILGIEKS